jgi:hypothetical protein
MVWAGDGWLRTADGGGVPYTEVAAPALARQAFAPSPERGDFDNPNLPLFARPTSVGRFERSSQYSRAGVTVRMRVVADSSASISLAATNAETGPISGPLDACRLSDEAAVRRTPNFTGAFCA